mmetsp:Transcript_24539/g.68268  ORF Transcript_24539/g.68268 Transcript_24539/m.68268 type:complete len:288 (-) Transcript_24539:637-1500(-)
MGRKSAKPVGGKRLEPVAKCNIMQRCSSSNSPTTSQNQSYTWATALETLMYGCLLWRRQSAGSNVLTPEMSSDSSRGEIRHRWRKGKGTTSQKPCKKHWISRRIPPQMYASQRSCTYSVLFASVTLMLAPFALSSSGSGRSSVGADVNTRDSPSAASISCKPPSFNTDKTRPRKKAGSRRCTSAMPTGTANRCLQATRLNDKGRGCPRYTAKATKRPKAINARNLSSSSWGTSPTSRHTCRGTNVWSWPRASNEDPATSSAPSVRAHATESNQSRVNPPPSLPGSSV